MATFYTTKDLLNTLAELDNAKKQLETVYNQLENADGHGYAHWQNVEKLNNTSAYYTCVIAELAAKAKAMAETILNR